jgi:LuxR family maltose regulon positive regulatory protein
MHRMRAAGELTELGSQDLAFTQAEISQLFTASGIALTANQATKVRGASGGWAMGLQLAALTQPQPPEEAWSCLNGWSTVTQLCSDFLLRELLEPMRPDDQDILLRTSMLSRFTAPLARAITGCSNASQRLRYLSTKYEVLDKVDEWSYEMNPMVRQALARELMERHGPAEVASVQQVTCEWFARYGLHHKTASVLHATAGTHRGSRGRETGQEDNAITSGSPWHMTPETVYKAEPERVHTDGRRLTKSELEVLALLPSNVTLEEIAVRRHVSLNTVKTQVRSIYRKLGAGRRTEAVEAARLYGLL